MKKILSLMLVIVTIFSLSTLVSCKKEVEPVVITISQEASVQGLTLLEYMSQMEENGELSFTIENGMVTEINGTKNGTNSYWMVYTNDAENSNTAWGTYEYNQEIFGSAILGAESLQIKAGCTYIWLYQTF